MIPSYSVRDNFFKDPDAIRALALTAQYYTTNTHPEHSLQIFPGHRTIYFNKWAEELYRYMEKETIASAGVLTDLNQYTSYRNQYSFSWTPGDVELVYHRDITPEDPELDGFTRCFAGVVYLHPNPPPNSGTMIEGVGTVENCYNRFVQYDAINMHRLESSFGNTIEDSRLVVTHFLYLK